MAKTDSKEWTPKTLEKAITSGSQDDKVALLKRLGILTAKGKTTKATETWGKGSSGNDVSRTPTFEETTTTKAPKSKKLVSA